MRKKVLAVMILCLIFAGISYAQDDRPPKHKKDKGNHNPEEMAKMELNMLKKELSLSETQEVFIKKILEESAQKMKILMESGSKDSYQMQKIKDEKDSNIKSILSEEQLNKFKEIKDKRPGKFKDGDGPPDKDR